MDVDAYWAIAFAALIAGGTLGIKLFDSKVGAAAVAMLVFAFFAGFRAVLLSFT